MKLSILELTTARGFLRQAHLLVVGVSGLFFNVGDSKTAARLDDIAGRLTDKIGLIDRLIQSPPKQP